MSGELRITANVTQAQQSLQKLQTSVQRLQDSFKGLSAVLTTVFSAAVISRAIQYADAIQDISTATGISIASVAGLTNAFIENGGSADAAQKAILTLSRSINEAAEGSGKVQRAFEDIGVSLSDLASLSEQDILAKTIQGLSRVTDNTRRLALANQLLGKESRLVDFAGVAGSYDAAAAAAAKYQSSVQEAARLQGQLDRAFVTLQGSILKVLEPLAKFVNNLKPEQIDRFVEAVVKVGAAAGSIAVLAAALSGIAKVLTIIGSVATAAWAAFGGGLALVVSGFAAIRAALPAITAGFVAVIAALTKGTALAAGWGTALNAATAGVPAALGAVVLGFGKILLVVGAVSAAVYGLYKAFSSSKTEVEQTTKAQEDSAKALEAQAQAQRQITTNVDALRQRLSEVSSEYQRAGQAIQDNLKFESAMVGKTQDQAAVARAVRDERERLRRTQEDLNRQQTELDQKYKSGAITLEEHRKSTAEIASTNAKITSESQRQESAIARATQSLQDRLRAQRIEQLQLQAIFDLEEQRVETAREMAVYQDRVTAAQVQAQDLTKNLVKDNALINQRLELEKNIRFLRKEDQETARTLFDLEQLRLEKVEEIRKMQDLPFADRVIQEQAITEAINAQILAVQQRAEAYKVEQSSFATGWSQAFEQFRNSIQTDAELAGEMFNKVTKGMEDVFVNFAKTGKLSFKDLMRSIVDMILRSQIQRLIAQIFGGGASGGGSIFGSFLTSLFGGFKAGGGPVNGGKAYVVGERGPELFMPRGNGDIIPNNQLGGGAITQVTYNINAVDAGSFRSLVASDPEFIFAVTEQGRRRLPNARR